MTTPSSSSHPGNGSPGLASWDVLDRYLAGECDAAELAGLEAPGGDVAVQAPLLEALRRDVTPWPERAFDAATGLARLRQSLQNQGSGASDAVRPRRSPRIAERKRGTWVARVAGIVAATVPVIGLVWYLGRPAADPVPLPTHEFVTAPGERTEVTLDDGTRVWLNVASRLIVSPDFGKGTRAVTLEGEAQFVVTHDEQNPFVVYANGSLIRDLATTFVVRAYAGNGSTVVAVREGKVAVQPPVLTQGTVIQAGQMAAITGNGVPVVTTLVRDDEYFAWIHGQLRFAQAPLSDVLAQLSRWYGLEFRTNDSTMLTLDVTAVLPAQYDTQKMQLLAAMLGAQIQRQGNVVTFISANPSSPTRR